MNAPATLTPHQITALEATAPRLLLVASAGSGKTEVLTRRVIRHLSESRSQTFRILAVTFTVRAAHELKARLEATASDDAWRVDADTIHGFALDWLMRFGQIMNVYPDTVVFSDDTDRIALLAEYVTSLGEPVDDSLRSVLSAIDGARNSGSATTPSNLQGPGLGAAPFADLYEGYLRALEAANGIDFPGMLMKFIEAARADPAFLSNFHSTYRHVLVDEAQDLSPSQAAVLSLLIGPSIGLFVVADDRQSINEFAGGSFENAVSLVGETALRSTLHLPHNFRCSTEVLSAAEELAKHLRARPSRALAAADAPPGRVQLVSAASAGAEAQIVAEWVSTLLSDGLDPSTLAEGEDPTVQPEDIAVIARARWLLDPVLEVFDALGIAVCLQTDAQSYLHTPAARALSEGVALLATPASSPAARRLSDELRGMGIEVDAADATSLRELSGSDIPELRLVAEILDGLSVSNIAARLSNGRHGDGGEEWIRDLGVLETLWVNYTVTVSENRRELGGFVRHMFRAQQTRPSDPGVRVLTIHKVKGLEFKSVCLLGAYNGAIPDYRASTMEAVDAERRAFYVAMTRAARSLLVTYPEVTVDRYGRQHRQVPSLFIGEAGLL